MTMRDVSEINLSNGEAGCTAATSRIWILRRFALVLCVFLWVEKDYKRRVEIFCSRLKFISFCDAVLSTLWDEKILSMTVTHHPTFDSSFHTLFVASAIFLNSVLVAVFLIYFLFTPFLLIGLVRVSKDEKSHKFSIPKSTVCVFFLPIYFPWLSLTFHHSPYPITSDDGKLIMMTTIKMINIHLRPNGSGFIFFSPLFAGQSQLVHTILNIRYNHD